MLYQNEKIFRYRYDFQERLLKDFIHERYLRNRQVGELEEIILTRVQLNGASVGMQSVVRKGDWIEYRHFRKDEEELAMELPVIYEDDWLVAISKPDFLPVIPNTSFYFNSLAILVKERYNNPEISPVHRLDIETSGTLLFGKTRDACSKIQGLFRERQVEKQYQAVTFSKPTVNSITGNLVPDTNSQIYTKLMLDPTSENGSRTLIKTCRPWGPYFLLEIKPLSGKTNQIRAHLAAVGCPIVGDKKYYPDETVFLDWFQYRDIRRIIGRLKLSRQALHCQSLSFINPFTDQPVDIEDTTPTWDKKIAELNQYQVS